MRYLSNKNTFPIQVLFEIHFPLNIYIKASKIFDFSNEFKKTKKNNDVYPNQF